MNCQLFRMEKVKDTTGLARPTIYRDIGRGLFPHPVKLGTASAWPEREVQAVVNARIAGKSDEEIRDLVARLELERRVAA